MQPELMERGWIERARPVFRFLEHPFESCCRWFGREFTFALWTAIVLATLAAAVTR